MYTEITAEHLNAGIHYWLTEKPTWPRDFHNSFYRELATDKSAGLTPAWWESMVTDLASWVALRPRSKEFIRARGLAQLETLQRAYTDLCAHAPISTLTNSTLTWQAAAPLFNLAHAIKDTPSPVFASKLCHFILPSVYPVIDQAVLGGSDDYPTYWTFCKTLWRTAPAPDDLIEALRAKIGTDVIPDYPWTTKIVELSLIGQRALRKRL